MGTYIGLYRGVVTATEDPIGSGRIEISVPEIFGEGVTAWAALSAPLGVSSATRVAVGLRWLVQIDKDKAAAGGEGISTQHYEEAALEVGAEVRRLQIAPIPIAAKGPTDSLKAVNKIVDDAQVLWDSMAAAQRRDIGATPEPFLRRCEQVHEAARALAETRSESGK
jgi:hypothetical protein